MVKEKKETKKVAKKTGPTQKKKESNSKKEKKNLKYVVAKKTKEHIVFKKRNGRYTVRDLKNAIVNGEEKVKVLLAQGLIKLASKKAE